ncbi:zinc-binding dehydrogenase [Patescibacteria group bacterium]
MKVRAYQKPSPEKPIELTNVDINPKPTDIVIKTTHAGLSKGDIFILNNAWNATKYPAIGTGQTVGIVEQAGSKAKGFRVGDRVGVGYILGSCMKCEYCLEGLHHYCKKQINTELGGWGGFAEKISVDWRLFVKIPNEVDSVSATQLLGYGVVAYSGILKAKLSGHDLVGVIGLGGLGHITALLLKMLGMKVVVFSHSPHKRDVAKKLGVSDFVLTTEKSWQNRYKNKFDLIINTSPADFELSKYISLLKPLGSFCYLGLPFNNQVFRSAQLADYGSRTIYGSYVGSVAEIKELLKLASKKKIEIDTKTFPISEHQKAIEFVEKDSFYKKVVLKW